ncbi:MAG: GxxExxY protein [Phycisphaerales bacterium]|nr:GxxExxY protein [Phycisphaerales bacterium]
MEIIDRELTERIIGCAIGVHRELGPGLLESAYEACLAFEFADRGIRFRRQVALPVTYRNVRLDCGYRMDFVVNERIVLEVKAVETIAAVHEAQLMTYLRLSGHRVGFILNFNVPLLRHGIVRRVL